MSSGVDQRLEVVGLVAGLLAQLAGGGRPRGGSPATSQQPGGQLPEHRPDRVAVLPDEQHPVVVVEREHRDRAGVVDEVADDLARGTEVDGLAADVPHRAVEDALGGHDRTVDRLVRQPAVGTAPGRPPSRGQRDDRVLHRQLEPGLGLPLHGRLDEAREQRVRAGRAGAELRVRLGADVVRVHVARQLDVLDQAAVGRQPRRRPARPSSSCPR